MMCPVEKGFWDWVFMLFPVKTNLNFKREITDDQVMFRQFELNWLKFLLHKQKFFKAFEGWFKNYSKQIYKEEAFDQKQKLLKLTQRFLY